MLLQAIITAVDDALASQANGKHPDELKDFETVQEIIGFNDYHQEEERYKT